MKPEIIYKGRHYTACVIPQASGSLLAVTRNKPLKNGQRGRYIKACDGAAEWIDAIRTAVDKSEAHALCHAVLND